MSSSDRSRIGSPGFPAAGRTVLKDRVNAISLAPADDFRRDSDLFLECARQPETQRRMGCGNDARSSNRDGELALVRDGLAI